MKNATVAFLFCLTSTIAYANEIITVNKPVFCSDIKSLIEFLSGGEFREMPIWTGKDDKSRYVILSNEKTKTWSIVQFNDQIACVLGAGINGSIVQLKPSKNL
jgi:hypothetical protein